MPTKVGLKQLEDNILNLLGNGNGSIEITDHRMLLYRDAEKQHPISSIDGLTERLEKIPDPVEPLTNEDLEELLK